MSKIKNTAEVDTYDEDRNTKPKPLVVKSHWNSSAFVELNIEGKKVFVIAEELRQALDNCTNT